MCTTGSRIRIFFHRLYGHSLQSDSNDEAAFLLSKEIRLRNRTKLICAICAITVAIGLLIAIVILQRTSSQTNTSAYATLDETLFGTFHRAAVVTNAKPCASIGKEVLKKGGNAVDAMIASMLCDGVTMPQSMGIGGGFFMVIYNKAGNNFTTIDARETAPAASTINMYQENPLLSVKGGLAVAVPGEMKGLWTAYQKFGGSVPWKELVMPTVELCEKGIPVSMPLARYLVKYKNEIQNITEFRELFFDSKTGRPLQTGDRYKNLKLARTFRTIAEQGGDAMYVGDLATALVRDIQQAGGIISEEDLRNYRVIIDEPFVAPLANDNFTLYTMKPPASGAVLAYILRLLGGMLPAPSELLTTQRITEAFKYGYASRGKLGDRQFVDVEPIISQILSDEFINQIRSQISDTRTWNNSAHYGLESVGPNNKGTANLNVLAENGDAVVATSTVNLVFGSKFISKSTGILLNDEMNDFSTPNATNYFGVEPSKANFIEPGKRPMSSMCPSIITDDMGNVKLLIGGAGGTAITTAVAISAARNIFLKENIRNAMDHVHFHHQLLPMVWYHYNYTQTEIVEGMKKIGHTVQLINANAFSAVSAIQIDGNNIYGSCDRRRPGQVDGY